MMRLYADEIDEGDRIEWCGLWLEVKRVEPQTNGRRPGRRFLVIIDGAKRSLHYFDSEIVGVIPFLLAEAGSQ